MAEQTIIKVLRRAADIIDERGWVRGTMENDRGCMCAMGAMDAALKEAHAGRLSMDTYAIVNNELLAMGEKASISGYNDIVAKDKRYVTRLLRRTARKLEASA